MLSRDSALSLTFYLNFVFICSFILTLAAFKTGAKIISVKKRRKTIERGKGEPLLLRSGVEPFKTTAKKCILLPMYSSTARDLYRDSPVVLTASLPSYGFLNSISQLFVTRKSLKVSIK